MDAKAKAKEDAIEPGEIIEETEGAQPPSTPAATTSTVPTSTDPPTIPRALPTAAEIGYGGVAPVNVGRKVRPGPLQLQGLSDLKGIPPSFSRALATARIIDDLDSVCYPDGVMSPNPELNAGAKDGKFRYDRDFLLQFKSICKEKPDSLAPLDAIGLVPTGVVPTEQPPYHRTRGGSGRHQASGSATPSSRNNPPAGLGFGQSQFAGGMGNFGAIGTSKLGSTSEERFAISNSAGRMVSVSGGVAFPGRPSPMVRSTSQGGPGNGNAANARVRTKRGTPRRVAGAEGGKGEPVSTGQGEPGAGAGAIMGSGVEPVQPLVQSQDRWVAGSAGRKGAASSSDAGEDSIELVDRKVKSLLNKLTMKKFESISDQIITWANKSENGRTLIQVIRLVFEKATDEAMWSEMYARLCRKMMEQISPEVQDDGVKNAEGKPITGGQLFRKYLLNRCQDDFERGWVAKEATKAALHSDEYYLAQKAKRRLGLIKFIGELFKLQMLTERIMHECVKKLLGNFKNPEEEEIESLCKLLATVGSALDTQKARAHLDVYFSRMRELTKSPNVSSRMQYMLQDVIELRDRKWITRNLVAAPTTLAQVHEAAAKEKAQQQEREQMQRQMSMSRGGSRRAGDRSEALQQDGWSVAGGNSPAVSRPPARIGDLSHFGKTNKATAPMSFGPSSVFAGKKESAAPRTLPRIPAPQN